MPQGSGGCKSHGLVLRPLRNDIRPRAVEYRSIWVDFDGGQAPLIMAIRSSSRSAPPTGLRRRSGGGVGVVRCAALQTDRRACPNGFLLAPGVCRVTAPAICGESLER